ncbi:glucose-6-phosphate isomerase [Cloacibacillus evryensis]|uniref:glucose-6-phosphate isomerase n=2 Tax=Cloacibacillus evryensis TaxID=508460 RepID=UPI002672EE2F|nr:glucose-6-phosphate isomerase [Cloacibacillus evryensis]
MKKISFSFGASLGRSTTTFAKLKNDFGAAALAAQRWLAETPSGTAGHGWVTLPDSPVEDIESTARWLAGYDSVIQVGIGGSALGNLMLNQALLDGFYNESARRPKFYLADNPDPDKTLSIWERVKSGRTALVGVSKSGATAETMTQFLWYRDRLLKNGQSDADILVITDPEKGIFRAFAGGSRCRVMELPASVGGRYSVLCPAGLVTAAALGIDAPALLAGAAAMKKFLTEERSFDDNPALKLAAIHLLHESESRPMSVLMPYSSKMAYFAEWYAQLWAESLGKNGLGTTPVRALGAIDQHSQVQLYTEGPDDKLFTLIGIEDHGPEAVVPAIEHEALAPLKYLDGQGIGAMLNLEAKSTAAAIVKSGHPLVWIELEKLDEETLGGLVFFYEYLTAITGRMMGIDPFDQPGVEQGKKYTYGLMGREGYEKDAEEVGEWFKKISAERIEAL